MNEHEFTQQDLVAKALGEVYPDSDVFTLDGNWEVTDLPTRRGMLILIEANRKTQKLQGALCSGQRELAERRSLVGSGGTPFVFRDGKFLEVTTIIEVFDTNGTTPTCRALTDEDVKMEPAAVPKPRRSQRDDPFGERAIRLVKRALGEDVVVTDDAAREAIAAIKDPQAAHALAHLLMNHGKTGMGNNEQRTDSGASADRD
jgi:hypothetical protein